MSTTTPLPGVGSLRFVNINLPGATRISLLELLREWQADPSYRPGYAIRTPSTDGAESSNPTRIPLKVGSLNEVVKLVKEANSKDRNVILIRDNRGEFQVWTERPLNESLSEGVPS